MAAKVFIGNIPFDATEEDIVAIASRAGPVSDVRIVLDRNGKSKGFGFCDYVSDAVAMNAVRTLDGAELKGRKLRFDHSSSHGRMDHLHPSHGASFAATPVHVENTRTSSDIIRILDGMSTAQYYEVMIQLRGLSMQNPHIIREILLSNPPFAYALLQAQVLLGIVDPNHAKMSSPIPMPSSASMHHPPPSGAHSGFLQQLPKDGSINAASMQFDEKVLLEQIMRLTPDQIERLSPAEQAQIIQLKRAMGAGPFNYSN